MFVIERNNQFQPPKTCSLICFFLLLNSQKPIFPGESFSSHNPFLILPTYLFSHQTKFPQLHLPLSLSYSLKHQHISIIYAPKHVTQTTFEQQALVPLIAREEKSMCSCIFRPIIMDNYQGDLTDIVRASGGAYGGSSSSSCSTGTSSSELPTTSHHHTITHTLSRNDHWHQHFSSSSSSDPITFSSVLQDPRGLTNFGDPFSTMRDPFLQELDMPSASAYFTGGLEEAAASFGAVNTNANTSSTTVFAAHKILEEHDMRRPCKNIFSNMIQISPNAKLPVSPYDSTTPVAPSPRAIKPPAVVSPNMVNANSSKDCLVDTTGVQISSPRNPGLKRRSE